MKILIDMNLSPDWVPVLRRHGWAALHWSTVGDPRASDQVILDWAKANDHYVFAHDLDFGTLLALCHATGPSVLQVRAQDVLTDHFANLVIASFRQHEGDLNDGALVVVDESRSRVRILSIGGPQQAPSDFPPVL